MRACPSPLRALLPAMLALLPGLAAATPPEPLEFGRYLSKYPGLYVQATTSYDARDSSFDAHGHRVDSAVPTYGDNAFPETRLTLDFDWHLPLFEAAAIPFVSSRLWNARARVGYAKTRTDGPIGDLARSAGGARAKSGISDLELAFGPTLVGSSDWRSRTATPLSVLLLAEVRLPIGARDPAAPNSTGDGTYAWGGRLGAHWQPQGWLAGFLVDGGLRYRAYGGDPEPAFGAQSPRQQGRDLFADATVARRLWRGLYAQVSYLHRDGAANEYRNVRFTANPPPPALLMDGFPDPATQRDRGTREQTLQVGLGGFVTQRLWLGAQYAHPLAGRSGAFDQPYLQQAANCQATNSCQPQAYGSDRVDGLGSARAYASDTFLLSIRWAPAANRGAP